MRSDYTVLNAGGFAFPVTNDARNNGQEGMSLRDYFAAKAMQGDWAAQSSDVGVIGSSITDDTLLGMAEMYYRMADAMIAARNK